MEAHLVTTLFWPLKWQQQKTKKNHQLIPLTRHKVLHTQHTHISTCIKISQQTYGSSEFMACKCVHASISNFDIFCVVEPMLYRKILIFLCLSMSSVFSCVFFVCVPFSSVILWLHVCVLLMEFTLTYKFISENIIKL